MLKIKHLASKYSVCVHVCMCINTYVRARQEEIKPATQNLWLVVK